MNVKEKGCPECDEMRRREGRLHLIGEECDICAGTGYDYLYSPCRHCNQGGQK